MSERPRGPRRREEDGRKPSRAPRRGFRRTAAAGAVVVSILLLYGAVPRLAAALAMLPVKAVTAALEDGRPVSPPERERHLAATRRALELVGHPTLFLDAARHLSDTGSYASPREPDRRRASLAEAQELATQGLARAPYDSRGWYALARIAYMRGALDGSLEALRMSWRTEPHAWHLYVARIELSMRLWPSATAADRRATFADIRAAWYVAPRTLCEMATDRVREGIVIAAFAHDPLQLVEVQKFIWTIFPERRPSA